MKNLTAKKLLLILFTILALSACNLLSNHNQISKPAQEPTASKNEKWAKPIEKVGLPNLHQVSNDLYRGAQPTGEGIKELEKMGIKTIVNLRSLHSDQDLLGDTNIEYLEIPMLTWHAEKEDIVKFLKIVTDQNKTPVFVHCQHGADRTGTMSAMYRIAVQNWSKEEALKEMTEGGFGFHEIWANLIDFIEKVDTEKIKTEIGI